MSKIKIVHVIGDLGRGGAERFVVDLCNEMAKYSSYELFIVSLCDNDPDRSFMAEISGHVNYISFHKKRGFTLNVLLKLSSWLRKEQPEIVHSHLNGFEYLMLYKLYRNRTFFFHTIHNIAEAECPYYLLRAFRRLYYQHNSVVPVTISANGSKSYRYKYHLENDITIENGRPALIPTAMYPELLKEYKAVRRTFILVHIGRIAAEKNQQLLIEAVKRFNRSGPVKKCRLLIIGEVQDWPLYRELKAEADRDPYIEFLGGKNNIADYLAVADAFCLSSSYEGMPISLIEAMSAGCMPVCTPVGGIPEMITDEVTGFLSQDLSLDSYYSTLKRAVNYKDKKEVRTRLMNTFQSKYHISISAEKHLETYQQFLNSTENNAAFGQVQS